MTCKISSGALAARSVVSLRVRTYMMDALGVPANRMVMLKNDEATRNGILVALEGKLRGWVRLSSHVYIFSAGHGSPDQVAGEPYLVPYDGDPQTRALVQP